AGAYQGWARHAHYTTAKAGIVGLVRTLAVELGPYGITANAVAPGVIETPQSLDPVNSLGPEGVRDFAARVPVRRNGQPEDIAHTFLFLASEEASFLPGQVLLVDGGVAPARAACRSVGGAAPGDHGAVDTGALQPRRACLPLTRLPFHAQAPAAAAPAADRRRPAVLDTAAAAGGSIRRRVRDRRPDSRR